MARVAGDYKFIDATPDSFSDEASSQRMPSVEIGIKDGQGWLVGGIGTSGASDNDSIIVRTGRGRPPPKLVFSSSASLTCQVKRRSRGK